MEEAGEKIALEVSKYYEYGMIDTQRINLQGQMARQYLNASMILLNDDMSVFANSADIDLSNANKESFNLEEFAPLTQGKIVVTRGDINGILEEKKLIVGYPVRSNNTIAASVLLISSIADLEKTIMEMYIATALCLLLAVILGFVLILILSKSISEPLRQMNLAAKQISGGDYAQRINSVGRDEVSQLALSLNNMAESLEQQEKKRREFIANFSHDLRSPLTSVRGFIQAIMDGAVPPEKTNHYLGIVMDETERLSKLANDIVDLSESEMRGIELKESVFDINTLIRETAFMFETRIVEKNLVLNLNFADNENPVTADREKIHRVIYNLLDNAIKFTPEGGEITSETSLANDRVVVTVKDTGIGVSPEDQKYIFDRFYKVDESRGEDKKGNGLGLSIVREFLRLHGSSVKLESIQGVGSAFSFELKTARQPTSTV
ncbi:MAG: HAMP domain-containing histidine kinase [Clostridiales bacterium]|nr:HAMP domain-containing histidine kinase [Clostridiales bacterium]